MEQIEASQDVVSQVVPKENTTPTDAHMVEVTETENGGDYTGQCKWFNDKLGYGFVTICNGDDKGKDIFVHHSGIKPLNSNYKTLRKGEYIQFNVVDGMNGLQAVDVRGIGGGPLMCDFVTTRKPLSAPPPPPAKPAAPGRQWQTVPRKKYGPRVLDDGRPAKRTYIQSVLG